MKKKVLVAMSGGVDSTTAAALLQNEGHQVIGVTMDIGYGDAASAAAVVAKDLNIEHYVLDVKDVFNQLVIKDFLANYAAGKTPNPCVVCNKHLKFAAFSPLMKKLSCDYLATGHYVRKISKNGRHLLQKALYLPKDQSYFLYALSQEALAPALFPLGCYSKEEVRQLARGMGIKIASKADSQDICFIPGGDYRAFYGQHCQQQPVPGQMLNTDGKIIGRHTGLPYYTVGQRKGLGLALGYPCYVTALDAANNTVIIGREEELYAEKAYTCGNNFLLFDELKEPLAVEVKVRYKAEPVPAVIRPFGDAGSDVVQIDFKEKQKSIAPGQAAVFYQGDILIGGGTLF